MRQTRSRSEEGGRSTSREKVRRGSRIALSDGSKGDENVGQIIEMNKKKFTKLSAIDMEARENERKDKNNHSACSHGDSAPASLHPTPKKKKKKRRRRKKTKEVTEEISEGEGLTNEGFEIVEEKLDKRPGCKDCLMENCRGAVTLYKTDDKPIDFSFIFKDDVIVNKEDGDKEAPIDPEAVTNPVEPIRIQERIKKKKRKKRTQRRRPASQQPPTHCDASQPPHLEPISPTKKSVSMGKYIGRTVSRPPATQQTPSKVTVTPGFSLPWKKKGFKGKSKVRPPRHTLAKTSSVVGWEQGATA